jgi:two-component system sensor histidine kinase KdpD
VNRRILRVSGENRTAALYAMSRELSSARDRAHLLEVGARHLSGSFGATVTNVPPDAEGHVVPPDDQAPAFELDDRERGCRSVGLSARQLAGLGTRYAAGGLKALYLPLRASDHTVGVLGVQRADPRRFAEPTNGSCSRHSPISWRWPWIV